jgi:acyl-CoA synthetase (NDP forming)
MSSLDLFFNPRSVILIGAAHTEIKFGGIVLRNLLKFGGKVFPVNPKYLELMGRKAYPTVSEIPEQADLAIIMRPAPEVPGILRELKGKVRGLIIISSGFAEIGETALQDEVKGIVKEMGVRMLGPNCMGVYNPNRRFDTFFLPPSRLKRPKRGNAALISQSGALISCLFNALRTSHAGASGAVGYGNAVDINESDLFDHFADDAKTDVVVSYVESVGDGRRFIERAKALSEKKPLLILKAGKGASGQTAASSHTGRLAGRYEVFHSILKRFGIREAVDFEELIDATKALSCQRPSRGSRILIITNGGGLGVLAADECMRQGLEVTNLPAEKRERLKKTFPGFYGINNPVDLTAQVQDRDYLTVLDELKDDFDGFLIIALPNIPGISLELAGLIKGFRERADKPVVINLSDSSSTPKLTALFEKAKIPVYLSPERAVRGLRTLLS